jgi:hypothetical protein
LTREKAEPIMIKAAKLVVKCLENEGVEYVFAIPGEENLDLLDSLSRSSIKLILIGHEQTAGFMAATYGPTNWLRQITFRRASARRFAWPKKKSQAQCIWSFPKTLPPSTPRARSLPSLRC